MLKLIHALDTDFNNVVNYYNSFEDKWHDLNCYAITKVEEGYKKYFDYITNFEPDLYFLIDDQNPNYIIGYGSIEDTKIINYHLSYLNAGSIGYGIRPSERKKGYGTILLKLLLLKCEDLGMSEVCVSALKENIASNKVILNNKGKLEKEFFDDDTAKYGLKYWIKLHPKITNKIKRIMKKEY